MLVEDVNDNQPIFSRAVYQDNVTERAPVGTFVARVSAADRDEGERLHVARGTWRGTRTGAGGLRTRPRPRPRVGAGRK